MNPMLLDDDASARKPKAPVNSRREAREAVLKILFAYEFSGNELYTIIRDVCGSFSDQAMAFIKALSAGAINHADELDALIRRHANNWEFERIAVIDRLILRIGICEFLYFDDIPTKVSINEAIEIGKRYSTEKSSQFINGILDAILIELNKDSKINKNALGSMKRN